MNRDTCGTCFAPSDLCKCTYTHEKLMEESAEYRESFYRFNKPALREAAQAVCDRWDSPNWAHDATHTGALIAALREAMRDEALAEMQALTESEYRENTLVRLSNTHQQLDAALAKAESDEYERIGRILGTYGGRWVFIPDNRAAAPPEGTAVYVRRRRA